MALKVGRIKSFYQIFFFFSRTWKIKRNSCLKRVKLNDTKHSKVQNLFKWIIRIPFGYCNLNFQKEKKKGSRKEYYFYGFAFSLKVKMWFWAKLTFLTWRKGIWKSFFFCIKIINQNPAKIILENSGNVNQ